MAQKIECYLVINSLVEVEDALLLQVFPLHFHFLKLKDTVIRAYRTDPIQVRDNSLFINCGGGQRELEDHTYNPELQLEDISYFNLEDSWACISTCVFIDNNSTGFIATNRSSLNTSCSEYSQSARLGPISLKYYGLCLMEGYYTIKLHFAQIMFTNDHT